MQCRGLTPIPSLWKDDDDSDITKLHVMPSHLAHPCWYRFLSVIILFSSKMVMCLCAFVVQNSSMSLGNKTTFFATQTPPRCEIGLANADQRTNLGFKTTSWRDHYSTTRKLPLTPMLLVAYLANTKWSKPEKWLKPGTCVLILEYSARALQWIPNTSMTGFKCFSTIVASLSFGRK